MDIIMTIIEYLIKGVIFIICFLGVTAFISFLVGVFKELLFSKHKYKRNRYRW